MELDINILPPVPAFTPPSVVEGALEALSGVPEAEPTTVKAEDLLAEETETTSTPAPRVFKPRDQAFADRVAAQRALDLLGDDYLPITAAMASAPKKCSEKVYNALCFIADRGKLSNFTQAAFDAVRSASPSSLSSAEMVALFKTAGYSDKTARSQAQQQMVVLPILKVALRTGAALTFQPGAMADLIAEAMVRPPADKTAKEPRARKAKTPGDAGALLAEAPAPEPETVEAVEAHDTADIEAMLVGVTEAPAPVEEPVEDLTVADDLTVPDPVEDVAPLDLSKVSPEKAIEMAAAAHLAEQDKKADRKRSKSKKKAGK